MNKSLIFMKQCRISKNIRHASNVTRQTPAEYCLELVRKYDKENFLCTLLLPHGIRSTGFAIHAFNVEVAQVADQVTDNKIGAMRLQFWSQTLSDIYAGLSPKTPVALELQRILQEYNLSKHYFKRLIDARLEQLQKSVFLDLKSIENYSENTVSSIYYLLLEAHGIKNINADHVASHLGKAYGITILIRSVIYHAQKRNVVLPQDILMKYNVSFERLMQRKDIVGLDNVIFEVATCAKQHLDTAMLLKRKLGREADLIFLSAICVENYLEDLRRVDFNIFHKKLYKRNTLLPMQLVWRKIIHKLRK